MSAPVLSVIVPAHQASDLLRRSLGALAGSTLPRASWELIVVDDASTDDTSVLAAEYADTVVRLSGKPHGPAFARNRGFEVSRTAIVVFVDADVVVHADALERIVGHLDAHPDTAAVFGSYDAHPDAPGLVSQYRNLLHHYVHHRNPGPAESFWAGIGAVRSDVFAALGMFDEWTYARPQIEDIELGRRMRRAGHRIVLDPSIQGTHLKPWTWRSTVTADFRHRGVPWMWLLIQEGAPEGETLNVQRVERLCTALVALTPALPLAALVFGVPTLAWGGLAALAAALWINRGFYRFLARVRGPVFLAGAIPLHVGYYLLNNFSAIGGFMVHHLFGEPVPPADVSAHAQIGVATWPPQPRRPASGVWGRVESGGSPEEGR